MGNCWSNSLDEKNSNIEMMDDNQKAVKSDLAHDGGAKEVTDVHKDEKENQEPSTKPKKEKKGDKKTSKKKKKDKENKPKGEKRKKKAVVEETA